MSLLTLSSDLEQHYLQHENDLTPVLIEEPIGWRSSTKKIQRSKKTGEFIEKNAKSISFFGKGRDYILDIDNKFGCTAKVRYIVLTQNPQDIKDVYQDIYFLDLESIKDKKGVLECRADEGGLSKVLKSKESESIELDRKTTLFGEPISELKTERLHNFGRKVLLRSEFINTLNYVWAAVHEHNSNYKTTLPIEIVYNSHQDLLHTPENAGERFDYPYDDGHNSLNANHFFALESSIKRTLNIDVRGIIRKVPQKIYDNDYEDGLIQIKLGVYSKDKVLKRDYVLFSDLEVLTYSEKKYTLDFKEDIELAVGDSLAFFVDVKITDNGPLRTGRAILRFYSENISLKIKEDSHSEILTTHNCIYSHELIDRHLEIITGKQNLLKSNFLGRKEIGYKADGLGSNTVAYPTLWLRGFKEKDEKKPSVSMKNSLESLCNIWGLSTMVERIGFKEYLRVEDFNFFYVPEITVKLPNVIDVSTVERKYAKEFLYSSYKIGYEKGGGKYEEATGIDEHLGNVEFSTIRDNSKKEFNKLSKFRADNAGEEFARRKHASVAPGEDTRYDDDWFVKDTKKTVNGDLIARTWKDDFKEEPKNIYDPQSATNLRLTPLQMLKRRSFFVSGALSHYRDSKVRFNSSNCNSKLELTPKEGRVFQENQDIPVYEFGFSRFKPYWIKFKHPMSFNLKKQLRGKSLVNGREVYNFYGLVEYRISENEYRYGYLFSVDENKGEFQILEANI